MDGKHMVRNYLVAIILVAVSLPSVAQAGGLGSTPTPTGPRPRGAVVSFGLEGGNSVPFILSVYASGDVIGTTPQRTVRWHFAAINLAVLTGLRTLARAEGFFSMPSVLVLKQPSAPDSAYQFIAIGGKTVETVPVRRARTKGFNELYSVLIAVSRVQYCLVAPAQTPCKLLPG